MNASKILSYFGYTVSILCFFTGITIVSGFLLPDSVPHKFRIMFGIVLMLYGIYRFVNLRMAEKRRKYEKNEE